MGFLFVAASLVVEHGALGRVSSVAVAPRSRALAQYLRHTGLAVPPQVGSFQTRNRTRVSCVGVHTVASIMSFSATLWTVAHQAPLSTGILQARALEWVAMPSSRGSS